MAHALLCKKWRDKAGTSRHTAVCLCCRRGACSTQSSGWSWSTSQRACQQVGIGLLRSLLCIPGTALTEMLQRRHGTLCLPAVCQNHHLAEPGSEGTLSAAGGDAGSAPQFPEGAPLPGIPTTWALNQSVPEVRACVCALNCRDHVGASRLTHRKQPASSAAKHVPTLMRHAPDCLLPGPADALGRSAQCLSACWSCTPCWAVVPTST